MNTITESQDPIFDIFLVQEPWWEKIHSTHRMVAFKGWQITLPKCPLGEKEPLHIVAYHRQGTNIDITLRNDITSDPDIMILDAKREGSTKEPT